MNSVNGTCKLNYFMTIKLLVRNSTAAIVLEKNINYGKKGQECNRRK